MAEGRTADPSTALPGFPEELGGVGASCAFPLQKGAHADLSNASWQEIRVRSGRDDKGECSASIQIRRGDQPLRFTAFQELKAQIVAAWDNPGR